LEPTGIKVLDDLLGGGFPRPSAVGITGPVGSGKSTMVKQIAAAALARDFRVLYYAIDESAESVKDGIAACDANVEKYESEGRLSFVDMFALGVERLAESFPTDQPEQITESTLKFSDLIGQGRSFTLKHLGKKTMGIIDSLTPFFLMIEARKVFQYGQVLKYATRFAKSIGIATLHTNVLGETIENAMTNFADIVIDLSGRKVAEDGVVRSRGGTLRVVKMGRNQVPPRGYYYEMTNRGIDISTAPLI
jgi:KaiC/GvpD/RAD55 family RecA-like ATPase